MIVLLPPSEGKTAARRGRRVEPGALSFPELTAAREHVLTALADESARATALDVLGVPPGLAGEVSRNTRWRTEPAVGVDRLYSGVLYGALDLAGLTVGARRRAGRRLLVVSAAWGLLRLGDRVPPYRLSMGVALPGVGPLAAFWRPRLDEVLPGVDDGLVVDCRSSTYAAAWRPTGRAAERTVAVRVLTEVVGRRVVVSHAAKHTRGLVTRHLVTHDGRDPRTPAALAEVVAQRFDVDLGPPGPGGRRTLDVLVPAARPF